MFGLGFQELLIVGIVAVLLFGKRLPEVARSLGSSYQEFRRGLNEIQSQIDFSGSSSASQSYSSYDSSMRTEESVDYDQPTAPKFELPASAAASTDPPPNEQVER